MSQLLKTVEKSTPKVVKIGGLSYNVEFVDILPENALGRCNKTACIIQFSRAWVQNRYMFLDTLIHEILHAIAYVWNIEDADNEERTITKYASGLACVYRDNPKLVSLIGKLSK